ncbi:MAG: hypothetical protein QOD65_909 [Gaiellales bacterium]|nr:hypothetical protein [Gaiellales bacterium]
MYSHLPDVDPTRSLDGRHRTAESEPATMRRIHRETVAAERAQRGEQAPAVPLAERILSGPAAAIMAFVGLRR